jgi:hypothetical protein
LQFKD